MSIKECVRCEAKTVSGKQCSRNTCIYSKMCWQHSIKFKGLKLKPSKIPDAGIGLFAAKTFKKNSKVAKYGGKVMTKKAYEKTDGVYGYEFKPGYVLNAESTQSGMGRYSNDCRKSNKKYCKGINAKFSGRKKNNVFIKASKNIKKGSEIYTNYGDTYWK